MNGPSQVASEVAMTPGAASALERAGFSRRSFLQGAGALIIGFSMGLMLVGLAILFESRREIVMAQIKAMTDELAKWE